MTGLTARLGAFVAQARPPADHTARDRAIDALVDTVGVTCAGLTSEVGRRSLRWAHSGLVRGSRPQLTWTGVAAGCAPEVRAQLAGTMAHALDFDDVLPGAGHPSAILLACALAAADRPLSGRELLDAYMIGYEVNARLAKAVGHRHYLHGWHTTVTIGGFGGAATASVVLGFDERQARMALGLAASLACGLQRNFGTMTKPLHSGLAARHGVLAAQLVASGFTAADDILEGGRGFLEIYGRDAARPSALDDLGERWALVDPGPTFKRSPCALEVYRVVDAVLQLRAEHSMRPEDVQSIDCVVPPGTMGPLRYDVPETALEAKFSMPYTASAALVDGDLGVDAFTDEAVLRPEVRQVMPRVKVREDVACRPDDPSGRNSSASFGGFVDVEISLTNGQRFSRRVADIPGGPQRPLSRAEQDQKFFDCLRLGGRDEQAAQAVVAQLRELAGVTDVDALLGQLTPESSEEIR